jgi:hypothetical protein
VRLPAFGLLIVPLLVACAAPGGFDSPVPTLRLQAIAEAARTRDRSAIPDLIRMLQADDPVVRMMAIRTLQDFTGTTLGYHYAGPEWERLDKAREWAQWYRDHEGQIPSPGGERPENGGGGAGERASGGPNRPISGADA